ncbi:MAG: hypothetical protein IPF68_15250 [Bacteroidales bacterium]|nr:hypothetical protein [Bacteroidales bacterium]
MIQLILLAVGLLSVIVGAALLSIPAAFIVGGLAVSAFALLWDFPERGGVE